MTQVGLVAELQKKVACKSLAGMHQ